MTSSLTDRYVDATVRDLDEAQRHDVERELRTTIEDMVDARVHAGLRDRVTAEREVLLELGDPMRLAAGYAGRPLYLIGPGAYPQWRRVTTRLLATVVPGVTLLNLVVRLFVGDVASDGIGPSLVAALVLGLLVALNVVFWVTLVFAMAERGRLGDVPLEWDPGQLPETDAPRGVGLGETVTSVVLFVLVALSLVWQQTSSPVRAGGEVVPVLDPALWAGLVPWLLALLALQAVLAVLAYRTRRWTPALGVTSIVADVAFAAPVLVLLGRGELLDPGFVAALEAGGWAGAGEQLRVSVSIGVVVVSMWSVVETLRNIRSGRRPPLPPDQA